MKDESPGAASVTGDGIGGESFLIRSSSVFRFSASNAAGRRERRG